MSSKCVTVCLSVASHIPETSKVPAIKFDTVTTSVMGMHHISICFYLDFRVQGHTDQGLRLRRIIRILRINIKLYGFIQSLSILSTEKSRARIHLSKG